MLLAALALLLVAGVVTYRVTSPDMSPAPATRESLAAVAVDVLGIEPSSYVPDLDLDIEPRQDDADRPCGSSCATWDVDFGEVRLEWEDAREQSARTLR